VTDQFDPRITPARDDIAAAILKEKISAPRYVDGTPKIIVRGRMALRAEPFSDSRQETELLFGTRFMVYQEAGGWAWGQSDYDGYVGYVHTIACDTARLAPGHRVCALATPLLPSPNIKKPPLDMLFMNAQVEIVGRRDGFAELAPHGFVHESHLAPLNSFFPDWVGVAERYLDTPYVWGGITHAGMDCSGLVQTALKACGRNCPRDADMQEAQLGHTVTLAADLGGLKRGDLIFWDGHVGIMRDDKTLLHANAHHMCVASETLAGAVSRISNAAGPVTSVRRL
jgi:cell wall-associated NlpC family hydrolase